MGHILVVDDESSIRELIKDVLSMEGHSVEMATNGAEGLALLGKKRYDLVIMDRNMPKMTGLEALRKIRATPSLKGQKVIMCTSAGMVAEVDEAFQAGADDYVIKPIDLTKLVQKAARLAPPAPAA